MQENPIHIPRVSSYPTIEFINSVSKRSDISFAISLVDMMALYNPDIFETPFNCDFTDYADLLFELLRTNKIYLLSNCAAPQETNHEYCELFQGSDPKMMIIYLGYFLNLEKGNSTAPDQKTSENALSVRIYPERVLGSAQSEFVFTIRTTLYTGIKKQNE